MEAEKAANYPMTWMCRQLGVARSSFYAWRDRTEIPTAARRRQYTSAEFHRFCKENLIQTSVDRTGVCWDNAAAESFFAALKNEIYHRQN
jgi:transposase InsO family protein